MHLERTHLTWMFTLGLLATAACASDGSSSDDPESPDAASTDPGTDPSSPDGSSGEPPHEAGAPLDGGQTPGAPDGGQDEDDDAGPSVPEDAGAEPPADAGPGESDAGEPPADAGVPDGGVPGHDGGQPADDPWAACPTADDGVGDPSWPMTLEVSEEATYCATFNESRTLQEELAAKMQLRLAPGTYHLPASEQADLLLPACLWSGGDTAVPATAGEVRYLRSEFGGTINHSLAAQATFAPLSEQLLRVRVDRTTSDEEQPGFVLDGREGGLDFDAYHSLELCQENDDDCFPERIFDSCEYESGQLNLHEVSLDGGEVSFELRLGDSFAGTEPGAFVRASGTFAGQTFDQTDYFKLVYHPTHHHFERTFAVLFDEPIDGLCGLEVTALEPFGDDVPDKAFAIDCELNRLQGITVIEHQLTRE